MRNLNLNQDHGLTHVTREIEINLSGPVRMVQQFLPRLKTRKDALIVNVSSGLAFIPFPASPVYSATKAAIHSFTQSLRVQLDGTGVTVVELAPPAVETPLLRGEFAEEMKGQKGMDVRVLAKRTIAGIEAGKLEIRPGLSNVLNAMSRIAPQFMLKQMAKMGKPKTSPALPSRSRPHRERCETATANVRGQNAGSARKATSLRRPCVNSHRPRHDFFTRQNSINS
jgi:uncharacterized oxidoreductase